jgi:hypothetical protein
MVRTTEETLRTIQEWSRSPEINVSLFFSGTGIRLRLPEGTISGVADTVLAFDSKCNGKLDCDLAEASCELVRPDSELGVKLLPSDFPSDFESALLLQWKSGNSMALVRGTARPK